jgi:hypothetical protein
MKGNHKMNASPVGENEDKGKENNKKKALQ